MPLWIKDLSSQDPYYVLPLLMGASMFGQTLLNPTPVDPMQKNLMLAMPVVFTVFFLWFPAGLVLYWLVNNILSNCPAVDDHPVRSKQPADKNRQSSGRSQMGSEQDLLQDTIAAIATPAGTGGIGIVRVSGPKSAEIARSLIGGCTWSRAVDAGAFQ
ncbi:MAG: hypothetical protein CM1200mP20_06400 [Pseudomonadota bacterium]|nr:MAG: hypothetical protein CM1200mP20_06400 [Pseudomonadota bacterium]